MKQTPTAEFIYNPYFNNQTIDYIYKAKIKLAKNNFGGLLIIKKIKEKQHRVVFTTEFGNKIFDFEFLNNDFKVHFILDKLNKKIVVNALKKDFQLLVKEQNKVINQFSDNVNVIYQSELNKKDNYYFHENKQLRKIVMASKKKEKVSIYFDEITNKIAKSVIIKHHNFNMTLSLKYIN
jgi:MinD-like ATPase involved in chromosome partitioning or flagellar assembly